MPRTSKQRTPLSEWVRSFGTLFGQQQGRKNSISTVLPNPDDYLLPALRVASSLADQICKAEEAGFQSPKPCSDWIDSIVIVVHLQSTNSEDDHFDRKAAEDDEDSFDVEKMFHSILTEGEPSSSSDERAGEGGEGGNNIRVEILPSLLFNTSDDNNNSRQATGGTLYSLGIVFYEIFSRGERPAELEQQQHVGQKPNGPPCQNQNGIGELYEDLNSLPFDQGGIIDLEGEVSVFDNLLSEFNLSDDDSIAYDDVAFQGQGPRKKRTQNGNDNICSMSVEPLKAKGLPRALCDLVANMVDCANGTISKDETYQNMVEVRNDLQLMLDKPSIYLRDQDMGSLSTTGLQIGHTVFGRNAELSTMIDAYRRSVSGGESELVTIFGTSGTGKSLLACEFGKYVVSSGGILLSGKFDQLQQGKPFSALASAFDQYCGILLQNCQLASLKQKLAHQVNHVLGNGAYYLTKLVPNLAKILGLEMSCINHDEDCINAQNRLQYLLCRFVEVISSTFAAPVTLCLDDLQWADSASIAAVNQLLLTGGLASQNAKFFFLGCYREGETDNYNPLWKALCNSDLVNSRSTDVKLDCMDEETLTTMVSETLCLFPRLTQSLSSIIYHKTKGNPLFVSQLMISLSKDGLLRPSLSRGRWEWDKEKISCQKLPDDVAEFLTHSIGAQPEDVKLILCMLSCFGASVDNAIIKTLEKALDRNLVDSLDVAVSEGLLDKGDDQYCFSHDRIQEAAYNMMNFLDRCDFHFKYGMALAPFTSEKEDDSILLTAVNQLNLAGPEAVQEKSQNAIVANLNLRAGKKAMEMSDFGAAYSCFDNGISFLRKKHWKEHYTLSLELFNLAAKCALTNGEIVSLELLSQQVLRESQSFQDKLKVVYYSMCSLAASLKLPESIEMGLDTLSKLGIELQGCESRGMQACVQETKDLLAGYTEDEILNTRRMTDPTMIMAMKFLGKLETMSQSMPKTFGTQRIIELSLEHGMSPVSPIGFVHFGSYMAKLGDIRGGYHYAKLARSLLDKVGSRESAGEVICFSTQVAVYVEPLQAAVEYHNEGYAAAMASGDANLAAANRMFHCSNSFFAGANLQTLRDEYAGLMKFLEQKKQVIFKIQSQYLQHTVFKLIGTDFQPKYVSEGNELLATDKSVMTSYYYQKAYTSFMFRSYDGTKENIEKYLACVGEVWANLFLAHAYHAFYIGLISFWVARESREEQQWYQRGNKTKLALKRWAQSSQWSFENKWYLLEAESFCNNDFDAAKTYYEKAVSSAKSHKVR